MWDSCRASRSDSVGIPANAGSARGVERELERGAREPTHDAIDGEPMRALESLDRRASVAPRNAVGREYRISAQIVERLLDAPDRHEIEGRRTWSYGTP